MDDWLWLKLSGTDGRLKLFDAAKMSGAHTHLSGIKKLQSFKCLECRSERRDVTRDKLAVGIGFHIAFYSHPQP